MLVTKTLVLAAVKENNTGSTRVSLSSAAFEDIASLLQQHIVGIMNKLVVLAVYRHKPKRILASDLQAFVEVCYGSSIAASAIKDAKAIMHGKKVAIKSTDVKSKLVEVIAADPRIGSAGASASYQKVPKATVQYIKGVMNSLVGAVVSKAIAAAREDGKTKIDSKHVTMAITNNLELARVFPEKAFQSRVN